jgi:hypothetical protein
VNATRFDIEFGKSVRMLRISGIEIRKNSTRQLVGAQHQRCRSELAIIREFRIARANSSAALRWATV